jgi:DNA-binding NarL/FixJ family response regulator
VALKVVLADDHQMVRQGLRSLLATETDVRLVGEASDGHEALRLVDAHQPDVLVVDLMLPGLNGFEVTRQTYRRSPSTRVVALSMHADTPYVLEALRAGVSGYVVKDADVAELLRAIRAAAEGRRYLSPPLSETALGSYAHRAAVGTPRDPYETLTVREREVLQKTVEGHTGVAIAEQLYISPRTVETHRANLMRKLGLRNMKELVRYAVQRGQASGADDTPLPKPRKNRKATDGRPRKSRA